jgi:hypothetical protein
MTGVPDWESLSKVAEKRRADATIAARRGFAGTLAKHLRSDGSPSIEAIKSLSRYLQSGDAAMSLHFTTRDGRPPKKDNRTASVSMWAPGGEGQLSGRLFRLAERLDGVHVSEQDQQTDQEVITKLADALDQDPKGAGKWKLVFRHPRRGNPTTKTRSEVKLAMLGQLSLKLRAELGNWDDADVALRDKYKVIGDDNSTRKKAVHFYMLSLARVALDLFDELGNTAAVDAALCKKYEAINGGPKLREKAIRLYRRSQEKLSKKPVE